MVENPQDKAKQDPLIPTVEVAYDSLVPRLRNSPVNQIKFLGLTLTNAQNFCPIPPKKVQYSVSSHLV